MHGFESVSFKVETLLVSPLARNISLTAWFTSPLKLLPSAACGFGAQKISASVTASGHFGGCPLAFSLFIGRALSFAVETVISRSTPTRNAAQRMGLAYASKASSAKPCFRI
jgi:hypothetical protein